MQLPGNELSSTNNDSVESSGVAPFVDQEMEEQIHRAAENVKALRLEASVQERSNIMEEEPTEFKVFSDNEPSSNTMFRQTH